MMLHLVLRIWQYVYCLVKLTNIAEETGYIVVARTCSPTCPVAMLERYYELASLSTVSKELLSRKADSDSVLKAC